MHLIDLDRAGRFAAPLGTGAPAGAPLATVLLTATLLAVADARAVPDLATLETVEGLRIVADREDAKLFYYYPGAIRFATREDGGPDLTFTVASYTGSVVRDDRGERFVRASFYARVTRNVPSGEVVRAAERALRTRHGQDARLRPAPIARLDAELIYTRLGEDASPSSESFGTGFFEPRGGESGSLWRERDVYLTLDPLTAQVLESLLANGDAGLSLSYAFFTRAETGAGGDGELGTPGDPELTEGFEGALGEALEASGPEPGEPSLELLAAGAIPIRIPAELRDSRLRRYHLDATAPPSFASLVVYCYDFRDGERDELFEKTVEVVARGVGGGDTSHRAVFDAGSPDVYARTLRFPFAVDLREPFRWRVQEIHWSGETVEGPWREGRSWVEILDASGPVARDGGGDGDGSDSSPGTTPADGKAVAS